MKCLRCGYCCQALAVVIVVDPEKGPVEGNLEVRDGTEPCRHIKREEDGTYTCLIHHYPWFKDTPCGTHTQIERSPDDPCRMGAYLLKGEKL
jgi:hypothetical protein